MRVPEPKEIHDHGVISEVGRDNIALISVFFALIAYNLLRYATLSLGRADTRKCITVLLCLTAYMHISDR